MLKGHKLRLGKAFQKEVVVRPCDTAGMRGLLL